jgi:hypothetical protein
MVIVVTSSPSASSLTGLEPAARGRVTMRCAEVGPCSVLPRATAETTSPGAGCAEPWLRHRYQPRAHTSHSANTAAPHGLAYRLWCNGRSRDRSSGRPQLLIAARCQAQLRAYVSLIALAGRIEAPRQPMSHSKRGAQRPHLSTGGSSRMQSFRAARIPRECRWLSTRQQ